MPGLATEMSCMPRVGAAVTVSAGPRDLHCPGRSATMGLLESPPMFADDNSSSRRAMRRAKSEERAREARREEILATLRRLRDVSGDLAEQDAEARRARRRDVLDRYPPQY